MKTIDECACGIARIDCDYHRRRVCCTVTLTNERLSGVAVGDTVSFGRPDGTRDYYRCVRVFSWCSAEYEHLL